MARLIVVWSRCVERSAAPLPGALAVAAARGSDAPGFQTHPMVFACRGSHRKVGLYGSRPRISDRQDEFRVAPGRSAADPFQHAL